MIPAIKTIVEEQMREDDETTAVQLGRLLQDKGYTLSQSTFLRSRTSVEWTFRGSAYCQMIRQANKTKRLEFAMQYLHEAETAFLDVVYTDETSIQLEPHRRFCCRKRGEPARPKPRLVSLFTTTSTCHVLVSWAVAPEGDCRISCVAP